MKITSILLPIPIGALYHFFILKLADVLFHDTQTNKIDYIYNFILFVGITSVIFAFTTLSSNKLYKNDVLKYGILLGAISLVTYGSLTYWNDITNESKLIIVGFLFGTACLYAY